MQLSIIVPSKSVDASDLKRLQASLARQSFQDFEVLIETSGNSEEAKAAAALRAQGDLLAFFCADNDLRNPDFLRTMVWYARLPNCTGAYTAQYEYVPSDPALNRYFALIGANDPLCWWLGKADRQSYIYGGNKTGGIRRFDGTIPSLGDNGFFIKRAIFEQAQVTPQTFGSCMCVCQDLAQQGHATYWIVAEQKLWHRTGDSLIGYLRRRYSYVKTLYFDKHSIRRWRMVESRADWFRVLAFAVTSLLLLPHLWLSLRGYRRVKDPAWFVHVPVCFLLTLVYTCAMIHSVVSRWSFRHWIDRRSWHDVSQA